MLKIFFFILCLIQHQTSACAASAPKKLSLVPCEYNAESLQCSLSSAAEREHWNCIIALEKNGALCDESDEYGDTILHGIASFGYYKNHANFEFQRLYRENVPKILTRPHINLNAQNDCGDTPLHIAIARWNIYFCEQLLNQDATQCHIKNNLGETAHDLIRKNIEFLGRRFIFDTGSPHQRLHRIVPKDTDEQKNGSGPLVDPRFSSMTAWENLLRRVSTKR